MGLSYPEATRMTYKPLTSFHKEVQTMPLDMSTALGFLFKLPHFIEMLDSSIKKSKIMSFSEKLMKLDIIMII